jgi:hypothetical protein
MNSKAGPQLAAALIWYRRMKLFSKTSPERPKRTLATLAMTAAVFGCLALGARTLVAGGGGGMSVGGGDAIGSLPFSGPTPPENLTGLQMPSVVFEAPSLAAVKAIVLDAYGDGYAEISDLPGDGGVRVELQGHVTVVLDRNTFEASGVRAALDVSQGFSGGIAIFSQNQRLIRTQLLPAHGDLALPLGQLASSGVLDAGILTVHSVSIGQAHHRLDLSTSGGTLRVVSGY